MQPFIKGNILWEWDGMHTEGVEKVDLALYGAQFAVLNQPTGEWLFVPLKWHENEHNICLRPSPYCDWASVSEKDGIIRICRVFRAIVPLCCGFCIWIANTWLFQPPAATITDFVVANQLVSFTKLQPLLLGHLKSD